MLTEKEGNADGSGAGGRSGQFFFSGLDISGKRVYIYRSEMPAAVALRKQRGKSGLRRAGSPHKTRMSWTIFHEKESAAENKPPEQSGKGEKAG